MSECQACGDRYKESCAECVMRALRCERDQALRELGEARNTVQELALHVDKCVKLAAVAVVNRDAALRSNAELRGALEALGNDPAVPAWIGTLARTALASSSTKP